VSEFATFEAHYRRALLFKQRHNHPPPLNVTLSNRSNFSASSFATTLTTTNTFLPLSWAAQYGQERIFELLLETGKVNADSKDQNGRTPLWWAVHNKYERIVKLLLETGNADVDQ
jgi:ankyrin repeat protein